MATPFPSEEEKQEALKNPNGYVYLVDDIYKGQKDVPDSAIIGAWKVDANGIITGDFIHNPTYGETR